MSKQKPIPIFIGLSGRAGAGKSTVAAHLEDKINSLPNYYARTLPLGNLVRNEIINTVYGTPLPKPSLKARFLARLARLRHYPESLPIAIYSKPLSKDLRKLLQWWGTDYRRKTFGPDYWIKQHHSLVENYIDFTDWKWPKIPVIIIDDVRFSNEIKYCHSWKLNGVQYERKGLSVWLTSPDLPPAASTHHVSERSITPDYCDLVVANGPSTSTPEQTAQTIKAALVETRLIEKEPEQYSFNFK